MSETVTEGQPCTACGERACGNGNGTFHIRCIPNILHAYFFSTVQMP